jgi:hypothetical protein
MLERNRVFGLQRTLLATFLKNDGDPLGRRRD